MMLVKLNFSIISLRVTVSHTQTPIGHVKITEFFLFLYFQPSVIILYLTLWDVLFFNPFPSTIMRKVPHD